MSKLKKYVAYHFMFVPINDIGVKKSFSSEVVLVAILDRQVWMLRRKEMASVKELWRN